MWALPATRSPRRRFFMVPSAATTGSEATNSGTAELGGERQEELARHDVVGELVDVAHDLGERVGLVHVDEARARRRLPLAHRALPGSAHLGPELADHFGDIVLGGV